MAISLRKLTNEQINERNQFFYRGLQEEKQSRLKSALDYYRMALEVDSNFFDSWLNAGAIYARTGKSEKAITCFQRAIISRPDKRAYYNLASEYFKLGRYYHALDTIERAIDLEKNFIQAYLLAGYCYAKMQQPKQAEKSILAALKIDPNNRSSLNALAILYFQQNRYEESLQYVNHLLIKEPNDLSLQKIKASLSLEQSDLKTAILAFKEIANHDPKLKSLTESVEKNMPQQAQKEMVLQKMQLTDKEDKNAKDFFNLSLLSLFSGESNHAMDYLLKATEKNNL